MKFLMLLNRAKFKSKATNYEDFKMLPKEIFNLSDGKEVIKSRRTMMAQLPRVYYHSWMTGPQGARFEIFKSNHSTEVINKTKSRLRYDHDAVKIYVVDGEPEDYDHKKERLEFYDIEENDDE